MPTSHELEAAAAAVIADLDLEAVLSALGEPHSVGSVALGVMVARDIDITVVCESLDVGALHRAAGALVVHPHVRQLTFRNDSAHWLTDPDTYPDGIYWGIEYRDGRHDWTIDVWFVVDADRQPDLRHVRELGARLTPEIRATILEIKRAWAERSAPDPRVRSIDIYTAVLDHGVRTVEDLERSLQP